MDLLYVEASLYLFFFWFPSEGSGVDHRGLSPDFSSLLLGLFFRVQLQPALGLVSLRHGRVRGVRKHQRRRL